MKHEGENLRRSEWRVETIPLDAARSLVQAHHYSRGGPNTATYRHGLIRVSDGAILGVAWWIPPTKNAAAASWPTDWRRVLTLTRLAIAPEVPRNGASFLVRRSARMIAAEKRFDFLLTYADEWQGHEGRIYLAAGFEFLGLTAAEKTYVGQDGRMMGRKRGQRTLTHAEMEALGFRCAGKYRRRRFGLALRKADPPLGLSLTDAR